MPIFYFVPDREADTFKMPLTAERLLRSLGATGEAGRLPLHRLHD